MNRFSLLCLILLSAGLFSCQKKDDINVDDGVRKINLISLNEEGPEGVMPGDGYTMSTRLCFNAEELNFWKQALWIEFESLGEKEVLVWKYENAYNSSSNRAYLDDYITNYGSDKYAHPYEIKEVDSTQEPGADYDYYIPFDMYLQGEGTYRFKLKIYEVERTYEYSSQEFLINLYSETMQEDNFSGLAGYWYEMSEK